MKRSELAAIAANGYWRETEARVALAAWRASGKALTGFAVAEGLSVEKLTRWRRRLESDGDDRRAPATRVAATFAPVEVIQVGAVVRVEGRLRETPCKHPVLSPLHDAQRQRPVRRCTSARAISNRRGAREAGAGRRGCRARQGDTDIAPA